MAATIKKDSYRYRRVKSKGGVKRAYCYGADGWRLGDCVLFDGAGVASKGADCVIGPPLCVISFFRGM